MNTRARSFSALFPLLLVACGDVRLGENTLPPLVNTVALACDASTPALPPSPGSFCEEGDWCWDSPSPIGGIIRSVARVGDETWVATPAGVQRFDGQSWHAVEGAPPAPRKIRGFSDGTAFVQSEEAIGRYDGTDWSTWKLPAPAGGLDPSEADEHHLIDIDGPSSDDQYASSFTLELDPFVREGRLWHFDGKAWSSLATTETQIERLTVGASGEIWGFEAPYGGVRRFDGKEWTYPEFVDQFPPNFEAVAVLAIDPENIWFGVNDPERTIPSRDPSRSGTEPAGQLYRFNGARLERIAVPTVSQITTIFGDDPNDVWAGTSVGEYVHWDGSATALEQSNGHRPVASFVRGADGELLSLTKQRTTTLDQETSSALVVRKNSRWDDQAVGAGDSATQVWGSAWDDVWAVGTDGLRLHFDGSVWQESDRAASDVTGVWGSASNDVWTVTVGGDLDHFDGKQWRPVHHEDGLQFTDVSGLGNGDLWIGVHDSRADGVFPRLARFSRGKFDVFTIDTQKLDEGSFRVSQDERSAAVWAGSTRDVWVATNAPSYGSRLLRFDGESLVIEQEILNSAISDVWGSSTENVYLAVGPDDVRHYDGQTWTKLREPTAATDRSPSAALWGCGDRDVFVASGSGMSHYDGEKWTTTKLTTRDLTGLWAASPAFAVAVGKGGQILRRSR